ncbi:MAG: malate synthase A, partial [Candidatus Thermoplasmatota archaeon]|nr:malate synthase A [Candidatus Thermoplasmatota archaeon]
MAMPPGIDVRGPVDGPVKDVLTPEALAFVAELHRTFDGRRRDLLTARDDRQARIDRGEDLQPLKETEAIRQGDWQVTPPPADVADRRVEITGPTDRKMMINALNSGANVFMADLEDSNVPSWEKMTDGQVNLRDANQGTIRYEKDDGTVYELEDETATLFVRPRGLHLVQPELLVDDEVVAGCLMDFGLYVFHNAKVRAARGEGTYFYLPKLESHLEARWWNEVFTHAEDALDLERGTIRATVLIETLPAAFEMEEILHELR